LSTFFLELVIFNTLPWDRSGVVQIPRKGNEELIGQTKAGTEVGYVAGTYSSQNNATFFFFLSASPDYRLP
jgi:hypothetical protein